MSRQYKQFVISILLDDGEPAEDFAAELKDSLVRNDRTDADIVMLDEPLHIEITGQLHYGSG